jgi:hypothetical protein
MRFLNPYAIYIYNFENTRNHRVRQRKGDCCFYDRPFLCRILYIANQEDGTVCSNQTCYIN